MAEGYCGKQCEICAWRERLQCPGCQVGPGRAFGGGCDVAACCREKDHAACATCARLPGCTRRAGLERKPEERLRRAEAEARRRRELDQRAQVLGRWLWPLFWLVVPSLLGGIMTNDTVLSALPGLRVPGELVDLLCALAYSVILWQLRQLEDGYRAAAVCCGGSALVGALAEALRGVVGDGLVLLLLLPVLGVKLYGTYREYNAHAAMLDGADDGLAENWRTLWKWEIGLLLGLFGCILLALVAGVLGLLALLADAVGIIVVSVLKLMYLYRTARLFRNHIPTETEALPE